MKKEREVLFGLNSLYERKVLNMAIEVFNRVEKKYFLDKEQFTKLTEELQPYMNADAYCINGQFYSINNIYFDTDTDELIRTSIEKPVYKEKMRMRSYGIPKPDSLVFLEIKKKYKGVVNKRRTTIGLQECYDFVEKGIMPEGKEYLNPQVVKEMKYFIDFYRPHPKVFIKYDRMALFGREDSDLRITFDKNLTTRRDDLRLEHGEMGTKLLPEEMYLMEIKVPASFPMWLSSMLADLDIKNISFSKYGTEYKRYLENEILPKINELGKESDE